MTELSLLRHKRDADPQTVTLEGVAAMVREDAALQALTENYRKSPDRQLVQGMPHLMVAGRLEGGYRKKDLAELSGLGVTCIRPDGTGATLDELCQTAQDDEHTALCFRALDGQGVVIVFAYELDTGYELELQCRFYRKACLYGAAYYEQLLHGTADRSQDCHTCVLAHDGGVSCRVQPEPFLAWEVKEACRNQGRQARQKAGGDKPRAQQQTYATVDEIRQFLADRVLLRFNAITHRTEYHDQHMGWQPVTDRLVNSLWAEMSQTKPTQANDVHRIIGSDFVPEYHPFRFYLDNLPRWNGREDYVMELSLMVNVRGDADEQLLFYEYLKKWLVGMVAAWVNPQVVNNVILVLIGRQGAYKTTWLQYLLPPVLRGYFYTKTNAARMTRDDLLTLTQYGLICCEELDTMTDRELNQLKATTTMTSVNERAAYARHAEHRAHVASYCGTSNHVQLLSDISGNRRWLPFEVENIQSPYDTDYHYDGLYSQLYTLYREGYRYWFDDAEISRLSRHNEAYEAPNLERDLIGKYYRRPTATDLGIFVSTAEILQTISGPLAQKLSLKRVSGAMKQLGFPQVRSHNARGYVVVRCTEQEMQQRQHLLASDAEPDGA